MKKILLALAVLGLLQTGLARAGDIEDIRHGMQQQWEKPDAPLTVKPVVVVGDAALAGWLQGERGGRAVLRKQHGQWQTQLCAGALSSDLLRQAGISVSSAQQLLKKLNQAEASLSSAERQQLDSFVGVVKMDGKGHHGEHAHHGQASAQAEHTAHAAHAASAASSAHSH
ncbi:copper uptake system-associated protein [Chitinibacter tainanensis]|uniref:copper uptake system-associated protein n=1 Tax=Chitinibacter tainanensis TaxID=230667 RepID=UPI000411D2B4|nr:copper uptake system-associated protein [Chitinibacter tainanensis]